MFDEAFPNAESIFHQAFATVDPAPHLLQILNSQPMLLHVISSCSTLMPWPRTLLEPNLSSPSVVLPMLQLMNGKHSMLSSLESWHARISSTTTRTICYTKRMVPRASNEYLLDCLLSGLSLKLGLTVTTEMFSTIVDGSKAPRCRRRCSEVMVVGSCIQLLLSGPAITTKHAGPYRKSPGKIADKLKAQKKRGIVKNPHAIRVLDVRWFFGHIGRNLIFTAVARNFAC